jgi:hypothetical protein
LVVSGICYSHGNLTQETGAEKRSYCCHYAWQCGSTFGTGGVWKSLEKQTRKSLECYKWSLVGGSEEVSENQNADRNAESKRCTDETSGRNEDSMGKWTKDHCCNTIRNLDALCLCPGTL